MDKPNEGLRERLLEMEKMDTASIQEQIQAVLEKRLSVWQRVGVGLLAGIGVLVTLRFVDMLGWSFASVRLVAYPFAWLGLISGVAWVGLTGYLAVRGRLGRRIRPWAVAGTGGLMMFCYVVVRTLLLEYELIRWVPNDWRAKLYEQLALAIFFMLVLMGLYLILRVVCRMELRTQEKLLGIEYRLAELAEKVKGADSKP